MLEQFVLQCDAPLFCLTVTGAHHDQTYAADG